MILDNKLNFLREELSFAPEEELNLKGSRY